MKSRFQIGWLVTSAWFASLALVAAPAAAQHEGHEGHSEMKAEGQPAMTAEQAAMMKAWEKAMTPGPPHAALAKSAGDFAYTVKWWMDPSAPPNVSTGTSRRAMTMGGRFLVDHVEGSMMEQSFTGMGITGYDNVTGKYWSVWMDNMGTGMMTSEGQADDSGKVVMMGSYPDAVIGGPKATKSVLWWEGDDTQMMEMHEKRGEDWVKVMEITYRRQ
jgi:hypothetical protein